ncbi:hypothetical protein APHAL10511_000262 [Amanita phalloides]|nr:hypothetical protein APHAL10511_000262 [Amanita phalloides]
MQQNPTEPEAWRHYGGFYRMVDFERDWTYTPSVRTPSLPDVSALDVHDLFAGGGLFNTRTYSSLEGLEDGSVQGLGLETATEAHREPALVDSAATSITDPTTSQSAAVVRTSRRFDSFVKKWFSSVRGGFKRRKKIGVGYRRESTEESLPVPPPLPPHPPSPSTSVSSSQENTYEEEKGFPIIDWQTPLALWEWKAWGYYARPWINGVWVHNYPPRQNLYVFEDIDVNEIADSLIDPDRSVHPERWIPGIQHPSLPPRPRRWFSDPGPYRPWQCQLNPYLRRKVVGVPPLFWDMGTTPDAAVHGHSLIATPLLPPDRVQPATWPMTTEFRISALADDVELAWPILIRNRNGVTVQDVLVWIYRNFQEYISDDEWGMWPMYLREITITSYGKRNGVDGLKRIDRLGFHSMFRGLEPSPDGDSWYLFVGRPW